MNKFFYIVSIVVLCFSSIFLVSCSTQCIDGQFYCVGPFGNACNQKGIEYTSDNCEFAWYPFMFGCTNTENNNCSGDCDCGGDCVVFGFSLCFFNCAETGNEPYKTSTQTDKKELTRANYGDDYVVRRGRWFNSKGYMSNYLNADVDNGSLKDFANAFNFLAGILDIGNYDGVTITLLFEIENYNIIDSLDLSATVITKRGDGSNESRTFTEHKNGLINIGIHYLQIDCKLSYSDLWMLGNVEDVKYNIVAYKEVHE